MALGAEILAALARKPEGMSQVELLRALKLPKRVAPKVLADLKALVASGRVVENARHRFRAAAFHGGGGSEAGAALLSAVFTLTGSGSAFAKTESGDEYFIPERLRGWALPGDRVELKVQPPRRFGSTPQNRGRRGKHESALPARKPVAEVVRVLSRGRSQWVGRLRREAGQRFNEVRLGELELELELAAAAGPDASVKDGDWIVSSAPGLDEGARAPSSSRFLSRLGGDDTPHLDTLILIKKAGLKEDFDPGTLAEAGALPPELPAGALEGRLDLRQSLVITIDGQDAKDFDDAVSLECTSEGWRLGVHIADVAHYVRPGSALDKEAYERGTSVYLPDRVLPMLPEALSNGLCSLKPKVDRLTLSAVMDLDSKGRVLNSRFFQSVIRSRRRCTYEEIEDFLGGHEGLDAVDAADLGSMLGDMKALALLRHGLRLERGALDFDFPETKVSLDEKGLPTALARRPRLFTHQLIEEFMLAANEA
ncbi:MAG: RNB domain-containing ribonuclease, partial [bacterium]